MAVAVILFITHSQAEARDLFSVPSLILKYEKNGGLKASYIKRYIDAATARKAIFSSLAQASLRAGFPNFILKTENCTQTTINGLRAVQQCDVTADMLQDNDASHVPATEKGPFNAQEVIAEYGFWRDVYWRDKYKPAIPVD